jgi:hypothetical protein
MENTVVGTIGLQSEHRAHIGQTSKVRRAKKIAIRPFGQSRLGIPPVFPVALKTVEDLVGFAIQCSSKHDSASTAAERGRCAVHKAIVSKKKF